MKEDIVALGCPESKVIVHYYGTDVKHFYNQRDIIKNETIKYLIISGFAPQKGHKYLIEAFATAYHQNNSLRLTIVGAGPLEDEIRNQIFDLKLDHVVDLPGSVVYGSSEHLEYFNSHDVFVVPSTGAGLLESKIEPISDAYFDGQDLSKNLNRLFDSLLEITPAKSDK
jgi:glycosyltransferase involved in cell wall biosynthesis